MFSFLINYASWGPIFWPFLRSPARGPTIKAVKGTVFVQLKRAPVPATGGSVLLTGPSVPLSGGSVPLTGLS